MNTEQLSDALEPFVDDYGLTRVLDALALCASTKADHVRASYQDEQAATVWDNAVAHLLKAEHESRKLFG